MLNESSSSPSALRFVAAVILGSIAMLVAGGVLYGLLFADLFREGAIATPGIMREFPQIPWIVAGQLGFAMLLTLVIHWRGATSWAAGAVTGVIVGFLMAVGYDFAQFGTTTLWTLTATLADPFISAALVAVGGAVVGLVLGGHRPVDRQD